MKRSSKRSGLALVAVTLLPSASGSNIGPDFGKNKHNPSRDVYKTKADVVKLIQQAVADGANLIQEQGDAGLHRITNPWGNRPPAARSARRCARWRTSKRRNCGLAYYRANNLVSPDSRR